MIDYNKKPAIEKEVDIDICTIVGRIYKLALKENYELENFSDSFLKSSFCHRKFNTIYSCFQLDDDASMWYIDKELKNRLIKTTVVQDEDLAYWIGFMYIYIYIRTEISSSKIVQIVPFKQMSYYVSNYILPMESYIYDELYNVINKDIDFSKY